MWVISVMQRNDFSLMESEPGALAGAATVAPRSRAAGKTHQARTARRRRERRRPSVRGSVCWAPDLLTTILILACTSRPVPGRMHRIPGPSPSRSEGYYAENVTPAIRSVLGGSSDRRRSNSRRPGLLVVSRDRVDLFIVEFHRQETHRFEAVAPRSFAPHL